MSNLTANLVLPVVAKSFAATGVRAIGGGFRYFQDVPKDKVELRRATGQREICSARNMLGASLITYGFSEYIKKAGHYNFKSPYAEIALDLVPMGIATVLSESRIRSGDAYKAALDHTYHQPNTGENDNDEHKHFLFPFKHPAPKGHPWSTMNIIPQRTGTEGFY